MTKKKSQNQKVFLSLSNHKMRLLRLFGHFKDRNDSLPTLSYSSTNEILKPQRGTSFKRSLPV